MREELDAFIGAAWGECSPKRKGYRNGTYTRDLATATGRLEDLNVPRDREGLLTVNRNRTVWLFIRADFGLLKLREMLMGRLMCTIAVHGHHIQNDAVVDHAVDGSHGGHRIFEDSFPFAEHEIGGDQHRFAFIEM